MLGKIWNMPKKSYENFASYCVLPAYGSTDIMTYAIDQAHVFAPTDSGWQSVTIGDNR